MLETIDCLYIRPQLAASFLLHDQGHALFIETNTSHSIPILLEALSTNGLTQNQVEIIIVTHVHLDHAGGCSALMRACPNALLLAHPRAVPHLIDPTRLIQSAQKVYGTQKFAELYGEIEPIDPSRIRTMNDQETLNWGAQNAQTLQFLHTRGHANHHFCIFDSQSESIFTGDSFGLAYPALQKKGLFIFPSTSPSDFDPKEARISIHKILNSGAKKAHLTHFGQVIDLPKAASQLFQHLDFAESLLERAAQSAFEAEQLDPYCLTESRIYFKKIMEMADLESEETWEILDMDLKLNAAGIAHAARKLRTQFGSP